MQQAAQVRLKIMVLHFMGLLLSKKLSFDSCCIFRKLSNGEYPLAKQFSLIIGNGLGVFTVFTNLLLSFCMDPKSSNLTCSYSSNQNNSHSLLTTAGCSLAWVAYIIREKMVKRFGTMTQWLRTNSQPNRSFIWKSNINRNIVVFWEYIGSGVDFGIPSAVDVSDCETMGLAGEGEGCRGVFRQCQMENLRQLFGIGFIRHCCHSQASGHCEAHEAFDHLFHITTLTDNLQQIPDPDLLHQNQQRLLNLLPWHRVPCIRLLHFLLEPTECQSKAIRRDHFVFDLLELLGLVLVQELEQDYGETGEECLGGVGVGRGEGAGHEVFQDLEVWWARHILHDLGLQLDQVQGLRGVRDG